MSPIHPKRLEMKSVYSEIRKSSRLDSAKLEDLVKMNEPHRVLNEVHKIVLLMLPDFDFSLIDTVFRDIVKLFNGQYDGYRSCNLQYHDLKHTTDCLVAMTRLIHGAFVEGIVMSHWDVSLGIISSLMHDSGYIQETGDDDGTGAKYTLVHIERSNKFMQSYMTKKQYHPRDFQILENCLRCTGLNVSLDKIQFQSFEHEMLGKMLGTADLLGQMADRTYLERLPYLYQEYVEGGVPGFASEYDLVVKTPGFWEFVKGRFENELGNVVRFVQSHFKARWGIDKDLYFEAIERNINYLKFILEQHGRNYRKYFRRNGFIEKLIYIESQ